MKILLVLLPVLIACGKSDVTPPVITVTSPVDNQVFTGSQTVTVKADISDNVNIHMVMIMVMDNNGYHQIQKDYHPDTKTFVINETFITASSKIYSIHIEAADHNENKIMKDITVSAN